MRLWSSVFFVLVSTPALASNYTAATCVQSSNSGKVDIDGNAHVENEGTKELHLICPAVIEDPFSIPLDTRVWVTDLSTAGDVCCEWRVKSPTSGFQTGGAVCSNNAPGYFELFPVSPVALSSNGARYLYCEVPEVDVNTGEISEIRSYTYDVF